MKIKKIRKHLEKTPLGIWYARHTGISVRPVTEQRLKKAQVIMDAWGLGLAEVKAKVHCFVTFKGRSDTTELERKYATRLGATWHATENGGKMWKEVWIVPAREPRNEVDMKKVLKRGWSGSPDNRKTKY